MSWRNTDCIYEGLEHIVDAFKDNPLQRPIKKIPSEFAQAIIELIQWRDNTKLRRKAMAIQRVIDRKVMWADEHDLEQPLYMYCVGNRYDLYGKNWGRKWGR